MIGLDKQEVEQKIADNFGGGVGAYGWAYYLIIRPNGEYRIAACGEAVWDDNEYVAALPDPYGDGRATEYEDAKEFLKWEGRLEEAEELDKSLIEVVEEWYPESWAESKAEALSWYAEEWLRALNGEPNDLGIEAPFGYWGTQDPDKCEAVESPFLFEWKSE